jgi:hypothetical protein
VDADVQKASIFFDLAPQESTNFWYVWLAVQALGLHYDYQSTLLENTTSPSKASPGYRFIPRLDQMAYLIGTPIFQVSGSPYSESHRLLPLRRRNHLLACPLHGDAESESTPAVQTIHENVDTHLMERVLSDFAQAQVGVLFAADVAIKEDPVKNTLHAF